MKKNKALIDEVVPKDGFVGIGNFDENWGYLRQVELPDFALLYIWFQRPDIAILAILISLIEMSS